MIESGSHSFNLAQNDCADIRAQRLQSLAQYRSLWPANDDSAGRKAAMQIKGIFFDQTAVPDCRRKEHILGTALAQAKQHLIIIVINSKLEQFSADIRTVLFQLIADIKKSQTGMGKPGIDANQFNLMVNFLHL
jgi:hypothetical protein